ncbi:hypothetical protein DENSPDRAFT_836190 [Dentipellis sp. KUC8613]|nr:hypothetical protein DENSPDRAFT_836190 [Dentipellis sp. KUC8613]
MRCFRRRYYEDERYHHRHHHHHHSRSSRRHAGFTGFLLFSAFVLFLLVAISLPIIKPIYLLQIEATPVGVQPATSTGDLLRFGVWGVCITSPLNPPTAFTNNGDCLGPMLGYTLDPSILSFLTNNQQELVNIVEKGITVLLVLHPVAAGLSLLTLLPILLTCCIYHNLTWILSLVSCIVTAIVSSVVLAADLALVIIARDRLKGTEFANLGVDFGNGVWMVLAGVAVTWLCVILLSARVCRCCGYGRKYDDYYDPYYGY